MQSELINLLSARSGHFRLESGHHGELWLDLELLYARPALIRPLALALAERIYRYEVDLICGPLVEGAFVGLTVAEALNVEFAYTERHDTQAAALYPVEYRLPRVLRDRVRGKRVAIVNDVINAGSAVRGTYSDLLTCGARPVVVGTLLVLGDVFTPMIARWKLPLESIATLPNALWPPAECPLCASGVPLAG
jgi:orotate phosphoribosyltransferase